MADAFSQAGYYDNNAYTEQPEGEQPQQPAGEADQPQPTQAQPAPAQPAQAEAAEQGEERLEDIVEDLKRKNATE